METPNQPEILDPSRLTPAQARYWTARAAALTGKAEYVDPFRRRLADLREALPAGSRVYRASTGGKWGKSATIATL